MLETPKPLILSFSRKGRRDDVSASVPCPLSHPHPLADADTPK